jgi:NSS family neurotransmitter:Na+ symporter
MSHQHRVTFGALGILFATAGSAVGLGNIWRFPYMVAEYGGAAFVILHIVCVFFFGLPVIMAEFFIGRHTHRNVVGAFAQLAPRTAWNVIGYSSIFTAVAILGFYNVVSGWTLEYLYQSLSGSFDGKTADELKTEFGNFISHPYRPIFWVLIVTMMSHMIIVSGVKSGIERATKIMMPMLLIVLLILCLRTMTLPNGFAGLKFLFQPDFSLINSSTVLAAMGQTFFSLSVGMGALITYSSYFGKETNLQQTAVKVALLDTLVALLAAVMIFPAVFSFHISMGEGPGLVFVTLPNIFQTFPGSMFWSVLFYVLLFLAALTSVISLHEVATAYIHEEWHISRRRSAFYVSAVVMMLAVFSSLSFGELSGYKIFGMVFFDFLDFITAKILMPLGGMFIAMFVGWRIDKKILKAELTNQGTVAFYFFNTYSFVLRYVTPIGIALMFLNELGVFKMIGT